MIKNTKENKASPKKPKPNMKNSTRTRARQKEDKKDQDGYLAGVDKVHVRACTYYTHFVSAGLS
jgi:hypothetical protein